MKQAEEERPLVSIIIPTYNYADFLSTAIQSCLNQTYQPVEIIVVDDGSTDHTKNIAEGFGRDILYVSQENQGVSSARNRGLELAKGSYLAFLDSDDYLMNDSIGKKVEILEKNPEVGIVFSSTYSRTWEKRGRRYKPRFIESMISGKFYEDLLLRKIPFQTSGNLIRSSIAKRFRFSTRLSNGEDIAYFSKIFFSTKGYFLPEPTVVNLRHSGSLRHNVEGIKEDHFINVIFDDPFYGGALDHLRKRCTVHRHLELSRRFFLAGEMKLAKVHYWKAISADPKAVLRLRYTIKFIKACLH